MANKTGLSENPGEVYSIASRCVCATCWEEPRIKKVTGSDVLTITVACCGQEETRTLQKSELVHIQKFFVKKDE